MKHLMLLVCFLSCVNRTSAQGVVVNYDGTSYEESITTYNLYVNEPLLTQQVWYGNPAKAEIFAQAWFEQNDGSDCGKYAGWPGWMISLTGEYVLPNGVVEYAGWWELYCSYDQNLPALD